ncbi:hypothetical protein [uncultured Microbulbifer sp.]|uniref:DUF7822 domain-containing protein n=1 Tax=uncultured Microbulbifer sp. TaxID=348147 RepID=UPI00261B2C62|nr:hypothetical protein [uncultured Microbulbifer sp.]
MQLANRSYLYSLSNQPISYTDRPESISGLSEWPYNVPLSYRILLSGNPKLCASLVSDGFESDSPDDKTQLYAISGDFEAGFIRFKKFIEVVRLLAAEKSAPLLSMLDETVDFLQQHQDRYLLLETIELDCMEEEEEAALRACVEAEVTACRDVGAAIDSLPGDPRMAADILQGAAEKEKAPPLNVFYRILFNDNFDCLDNDTPLGLYWSDVLYCELENKEEFDEFV